MEKKKSGLDEKHSSLKVLSFIAIIILIGTSISGCSDDDDNGNGDGGEITRENTMIYDTIGEPESLDPAFAYDTASGLIIQNVYDRLLTYEGSNTDSVVPMLLENMPTYTEGGVDYEFKLREDVKFSNGNPLTAHDVKYSFDRVIKMNQGPAWVISQVMDEQSTTVIDDYNFKIKLEFPYAGFLHALTFHSTSIVDKETFEQHSDSAGQRNTYWDKNMMGTGPFHFDKWDPGQQIELIRNENYWKGWDEEGRPFFRKVIIRQRDEFSVRKQALILGDCDIAYIPTTIVDTLRSESEIYIDEGGGKLSFSIIFITFNCEKKPFDNILVRQAFSYAFDYDEALQYIVKGYGVQGTGPIPIGMLGHNPNTKQYRMDPEKAKELLEEAGYPNGTGFPKVEMIYNQGNEVRKQTLMLLQQNLADIGITVSVKSLDWPTFLTSVKKGDFQVSMSGWAPDYNDPDDYVYPLCHTDSHGAGGNHAYYTNETVDEWIMQGKKELNSEKRVPIYYDIQDAIVDDAPNIWVYQAKPVRCMRTWVEGHEYNPLLLYNFYELYKEVD